MASMGGVDLADAKRTVYSCSRKSKKWWHRMFYFVIDVCLVNAHIILSETPHQSKPSQKDFRLELPMEVLASHNSRKHHKRGSSSLDGPPSAVFADTHFPDKLSQARQCRFCRKTKETTYYVLLQRLQLH